MRKGAAAAESSEDEEETEGRRSGPTRGLMGAGKRTGGRRQGRGIDRMRRSERSGGERGIAEGIEADCRRKDDGKIKRVRFDAIISASDTDIHHVTATEGIIIETESRRNSYLVLYRNPNLQREGDMELDSWRERERD